MPAPFHYYELPFPPSVNAAWRSTNKGVLLSRRGRQFRADVLGLFTRNKWPRPRLLGRLAVSVVLYEPDARRRDLDNYGKATFDALTHAGVWRDDCQIDDLRFTRGGMDRDNPRVVVVVQQLA